MSDPRRPYTYTCPYLETCVFPVPEEHFKKHCKVFSEVAIHPPYEQCQGYNQMNILPRNWNNRLYKMIQDQAMASSRYRV